MELHRTPEEEVYIHNALELVQLVMALLETLYTTSFHIKQIIHVEIIILFYLLS